MSKRKDAEESWEREEFAVPLPIQIFLWRQSSPFIRPKLGKLHEATCMEIKEASKSLEKVLVQNILFGLSPSLTEAIRSVQRWRFVQAALPHVMHCAATLLYNRRDATITNLGAAETKLLYTLHWILLDAAEECADADTEKIPSQKKSPFYYLFSISSIQVFIYMFAPLLHSLKESDFQNFRLENGLKIWSPMWEYRHPDVPVFITPVRPKRVTLKGKRVRRSNTQFGDVFLGCGKAASLEDDGVFSGYGFDGGHRGSRHSAVSSPHDVVGSDASKLEEELRLLGGPRETSFPETIPEETSSTEEEHVVIFRLGSYPDSDTYQDSQVYKAEHLSSLLRPPLVEVSDVSGGSVPTQVQSPPSHPPSMSASTPTDSQSPRPIGTASPLKSSSIGSGGRVSPLVDPTMATIMDVAVMRCLFVHQWTEEGIFWALTFIYRRLQDIGYEVNLKEPQRQRSNSLPIPQIHVSFHCDEEEQKLRGTDTSEQSSSEHDLDSSDKRGQDSDTTSKAAGSKDGSNEDSHESARRTLLSRKSFIVPKDLGKKSNDEERSSQRPRKLWTDLKVLTFTAFGYRKTSIPSLPITVPPPSPAPTILSETTSTVEEPFAMDSLVGKEPQQDRDTGGSTKKKKKISELKAFVETKLRSRSEKALEKIGRGDDSRRSSLSDDQLHPEMNENERPRPRSALGKFDGKIARPLALYPASPGLVKGKSMPSLSDLLDETSHSGYVGSVGEADVKRDFSKRKETVTSTSRSVTTSSETKTVGATSTSSAATTGSSAKVKKPIITVTQHTSSPGEPGWKDQLSHAAEHIDAQQYQYFTSPPSLPMPTKPQPTPEIEVKPPPQPKPPLERSRTDSTIHYTSQECPEIPGSSHFVTKEGHINLIVLLKAAQSIAGRESSSCSLRVCELLLNLLDFLLDMGILKMSITLSKMEQLRQDRDHNEIELDPFYQELKKSNPLETYMDTTMRIIIHLGCPHGCGEGYRGPPADFLRHTTHSLLSRIYRSDQDGFRSYLRLFIKMRPLVQIVDFFHSFLGFCVDPTSLLSPMSEWITRMQDTKRPGTGRAVESQQGGYATNFGASLGGAGARGIEGQLMTSVLKALVTRLAKSHSTLKGPDNMGLYSDIRQLMCYVKEAHGGVFRRVALSGLIDSADRPHKRAITTKTTRIVRRLTMSENIRETPSTQDDSETAKSKKGLFKKKGTSSSLTSGMKKTSSFSSVYDDQTEESPHGQSPVSTSRRRLAGSSDHLVPYSSSRKKRISKLVNWIRKKRRKSDEPVGLGAMMFGLRPPPEVDPPPSRKQSQQMHPSRPRLVTKPGSGSLGQKLVHARKRVEDHFSKITFGKNKRKDSNSDESPVLSRRNSEDVETSTREASIVLLRDRKMVDLEAVKEGMMRLTFIMETCHPGSVPDTQLAGAIIDLPGAPVIARAAILLEMCYFVHKCNRGAWPSWMKSSLPLYRPTGPMNRAAQVGPRRIPALQTTAGKMFYGWGEAIGIRLEELLEEIGPTIEEVTLPTKDPSMKVALRTREEEEDFLDELNVNPTGSDCPMPLRMVAVFLLFEITSFLRETYPLLPKSGRTSIRERPTGWHGAGNLGVKGEHSRRCSATLSSVGQTHTSVQSLHSVGEGPSGPGERKISFALQEADNESVNSSNTTQTSMHIYEEERRRQAGKGHLLKKGGGSFKRRSYKLKRPPKEVDSEPVMRADSIRSRRKVSAVSERSDTSEHQEHEVSGEESPGILSNEDLAESPADVDVYEENISGNFPWLRVMARLATYFNTKCTHQNFCHPYCYRRQMRACKRLIHAVRKVYGDDFEEVLRYTSQAADAVSQAFRKDKKPASQKTSDQGSPSKRRDSLTKKDKTEKGTEVSGTVARLSQQGGSAPQISRDPLERVSDKEEVKRQTSKGKTAKKETFPILKYLKCQVSSLFSAPFSLLIKSFPVLPEDLILDVLPMAWHWLLEYDNETCATAAVIFILSGIRNPTLANSILNGQLTHLDPTVRLKAILRFRVIWKSRYQVWVRMEDGAQVTFKVPPHGIEFTLPSPKIGIESIPVVDPSWMPQVKPNVEEVTLDQIQHKRSFITANRTRRKIHAEMVKMALENEEAKRRTERENFILSAVPVTIQAAYEPSLHHVVPEDHEEGEENDLEMGGRLVPSHHVTVAQQLFPSCLCSSVLTIIHLLDDPAVTPDGVAVYQTADQVVWSCLVEDSALFLRFFLEKLTREKQDVMTRLLRRLIRFIPRLPSQAAFALFNYLVGYVMFYTRTPQESSQEHTSAALSILWMVVQSAHGIMFKDLKQIFRKEQCDSSLLLTANIPSAKKIIVHGPDGADAGGIPSQFPIQEDTQFSQIHVEAADFFGISEDDLKYYFLVDHKTNQIHNMHSYVRDFYFFKRSQYPQLTLLRMEPQEAFEALQRQAFILKLNEIGKVLLTYSVLGKPDQAAQRVFFLHEELTKLPSFPRKALEADFNLYKGGSMDKEIRGLDQLHKYMWVLLISRMFEGLSANLNYTNDLRIFMSVINGALILHCEDSSMLRLCMATYINAAIQFKSVFSSNGYMLIMPTILRVYSNYQSNKMVCKVIEMVVKQLYILHRKPFVLQMLGSVAPLLDTDETAVYGDANKIRGSRLFDLLHSLDRNHEDHLHILDLLTCEKPLRALDFCYHGDSDNLSILEVIDMCVTVVAYAADSRRGHQMLAILEAILTKTMQHYQKTSKRDLRQERETIHHVAFAIKTLVINSEPLAKNYNGPQPSGMGDGWGSNRAAYTKASRTVNAGIDIDEESHSKYISDPKKPPSSYQSDIEDPELLRHEFRQPRATLLNIVAEFFHICTPRLVEINKKYQQETKQSDLLDTKCHIRLAEIAHSLLKMAPYDPLTMGCQGLQRYMNETLPSPDWSHEDLRPALVNILRRLEKMFTKLLKKFAVRRITDWVAASSILKGVYTTLAKHPYIAHLPHLKMLVQVCQSLVLGERSVDPEASGQSSSSALSNTPPQEFTSVVVRIITMQLLALGVHYSLEQICGHSCLFPNSEKNENFIINLLLPMCLRIGCASKDTPKMRQLDISFALTVLLYAMNPLLAKVAAAHSNPQARSGQPTKSGQPARAGQGSDPRSQSWTHYHHDSKVAPKVKPTLLKITFLGLKILVVCFDKQLSREWYKVIYCLRDMDSRNEGGLSMLDFLDFVVSYRTGLYLQMRSFVFQKLSRPGGSEAIVQYKASIKGKITSAESPLPPCKGAMLRSLGHQLKILKDELLNAKVAGTESLRLPSLEIQSEVSNILRRRKVSTAIPSPISKSKDEAASEPSRLYRKTFLMRKRPSTTNLLLSPKGDGSSISSPTTPQGTNVNGDGGSSGSTEDSAGKHRLQRQMAQSRKTFRFRKSRHGQSEGKVRGSPDETGSQQSISHIEVDPSHSMPLSIHSTIAAQDSTIRQLQVPLIPEEELPSSSPPKYYYASQPPLITQSQKSKMTSEKNGYHERLAEIAVNLENLEGLEMQVQSGYYRKPLLQDKETTSDVDDSSSKEAIILYQQPSSLHAKSGAIAATTPTNSSQTMPIIYSSPEMPQYHLVDNKSYTESYKRNGNGREGVAKPLRKTGISGPPPPIFGSSARTSSTIDMRVAPRICEIQIDNERPDHSSFSSGVTKPHSRVDERQSSCGERQHSRVDERHSSDGERQHSLRSQQRHKDDEQELVPSHAVQQPPLQQADIFGSEESQRESDTPLALIISGGGLPEGAQRFVVDEFTVTFTEKGEDDTLI